MSEVIKQIACEIGESLHKELIVPLQQQLADLQSQLESVVAENAALKQSELEYDATCREEFGSDWVTELNETPTTDAILAEVRAQSRNEGINYAASRLAAAFNNGFVDKPLTEVCDVVRMILDTKEEMAGSTLPADDGLSGDYAEEFLEYSAAQIRKGVQS